MSHLLPDSENIFKKHVHEDKEIKSMALLRGTIQEAITQLSSQASVEVNLQLGDDLKIHKVMLREEFEDVNKEVFEKCERLIIQCLQDAEVEAKNINDVIIVGGCWNIPKMKNLVTKICKRDELYRGMNPLVAALQGVATVVDPALGVAHPFGKLKLSNFHFSPLAIGIRAYGNNFVPVIPRNKSLPRIERVVFTTIHDNQTAALIFVYEGNAQKADENQNLGYFKITTIPEASKGVPEIHVSMAITEKNRLTINASVVMPVLEQHAIPVEATNIKIDDGKLSSCCDTDEMYDDTMGVTLFVHEPRRTRNFLHTLIQKPTLIEEPTFRSLLESPAGRNFLCMMTTKSSSK